MAKLNNELKIMCNENEELKRRVDELAKMVESKNKEVRNLSETTMEMDQLSYQVKNLNEQIRRVSGENEGLYSEVREGQEKLRLSNNQTSKMVMELESLKSQLTQYTQENEELRKRTMDTNELARRIPEYENKIALLSQ